GALLKEGKAGDPTVVRLAANPDVVPDAHDAAHQPAAGPAAGVDDMVDRAVLAAAGVPVEADDLRVSTQDQHGDMVRQLGAPPQTLDAQVTSGGEADAVLHGTILPPAPLSGAVVPVTAHTADALHSDADVIAPASSNLFLELAPAAHTADGLSAAVAPAASLVDQLARDLGGIVDNLADDLHSIESSIHVTVDAGIAQVTASVASLSGMLDHIVDL